MIYAYVKTLVTPRKRWSFFNPVSAALKQRRVVSHILWFISLVLLDFFVQMTLFC